MPVAIVPGRRIPCIVLLVVLSRRELTYRVGTPLQVEWRSYECEGLVVYRGLAGWRGSTRDRDETVRTYLLPYRLPAYCSKDTGQIVRAYATDWIQAGT